MRINLPRLNGAAEKAHALSGPIFKIQIDLLTKIYALVDLSNLRLICDCQLRRCAF